MKYIVSFLNYSGLFTLIVGVMQRNIYFTLGGLLTFVIGAAYFMFKGIGPGDAFRFRFTNGKKQ